MDNRRRGGGQLEKGEEDSIKDKRKVFSDSTDKRFSYYASIVSFWPQCNSVKKFQKNKQLF